jgi:hypothetical protein
LAVEPIGTPSPTKTAPETPTAAEIEAEINPWEKRKADVDPRI